MANYPYSMMQDGIPFRTLADDGPSATKILELPGHSAMVVKDDGTISTLRVHIPTQRVDVEKLGIPPALVECEVCWAVVRKAKTGEHAKWHTSNDEWYRPLPEV